MQTPDYKQIINLLNQSQELNTFNPQFGYFSKAYAAQKLNLLYKKSAPADQQQLLPQLKAMINELEQLKQQYPQLANKEENKKIYTEFVYKFFLDADNREREGEVSKELLQMFQTAVRLFDILNYFDPLTQDQQEKLKYAKVKMVDQNKKIKNPELMKPKQEIKQEANINEGGINQPMQNLNVHGSVRDPNQKNQLSAPPPPAYVQSVTDQESFQNTHSQQNQPQPPQNIAHPQQPPAIVNPYQPPVIVNSYQPQQPITQQPMQSFKQPAPQQQQPQQQSAYKAPIVQNEVQHVPQVVQPTQIEMSHKAQPQKINLTPMQQAEARTKAKKMLSDSISELDFKKYDKAKSLVESALALVQQLQDSQ